MDDLTFNFNNLWKVFSTTGSENLMLSVYQSNISFVVFKRSKGDEKSGPIIKWTLCDALCSAIVETCKTLLNSQPDTRIPLIQQEFNKDSRSIETKSTFVFCKDDKRCYHIEITNKYLPTPLKFPFKAPNTFSTTNEAMPAELKSEYEFKAFIKLFEFQLPMAKILSNFNKKPYNKRQVARQPAGAHQYNNNQSRDPYKNTADEEADLFG